ncbi:MAG: glycosyltransferase family 2 protein [Methanobrevibacter sp.]|uniref:glycosyltransferase family 2 protein n=1 Tax=Methanobrevibacter sp. TaxID=66852 RepID=UPI0025F04BF2|nr:glycosyltransferase family 2 protein [Methanobrevibacter sp.]MBQ6100230.1 glycosyltransferase family 2 protein [Methanobrevibacter sp.]
MVKVSVIIPVYNAEKYLEESIDGILNQTLDDLEVLCVDDGSTDRSLEILKEISAKDERVKYFHQENRGGGAARNVAIPKASGKYIYFMDADDILETTALKEFWDIAEEKELDFLLFQATNYAEDTGEYYETEDYTMAELAEEVGDKIFSYEDIGDLLFKMSVTPWSKFYNREFVIKSGAQFAEGLIFHDNIFFFDIIFQAKRIYFYKKCLYTRRRHSASSTGAGDLRFVDFVTISDMIWEKCFKHDVFDRFIKELAFKKVNKVYARYKGIKDEFKPNYYEAMKKDYERIASDERFCKFFYDALNNNDKRIFKVVLKSKDFDDFKLLIKNYELTRDNEWLTNENLRLNKLNSQLTNSNSWQMTKKLRRN